MRDGGSAQQVWRNTPVYCFPVFWLFVVIWASVFSAVRRLGLRRARERTPGEDPGVVDRARALVWRGWGGFEEWVMIVGLKDAWPRRVFEPSCTHRG